jgi:hypothetical protein
MSKQIKTIKLKVKGDCPIAKDVINEYNECYNRCSNWINNNLTNIKIGEIAKFLKDTTGKTAGYIEVALSDKWIDKPMYYLFTDQYDENHSNNLLYSFIKKNNFDMYDGNILNISDTYYRKNGYFKLVAANYRTKIRTLNCKIKRKKVDVDSTSEDIENQVMYEVINNSLNKKTDWDNYISYLENVENPNIDIINRYKLLCDYFCENEDVIKNKIEFLSIEQLKDFGGCIRKQHINTITVNIQHFKIEEKENSFGFILHLPLNKKAYQIELWGHRQINKGTKERDAFLNTYGESIVFKINSDESYVSFTYKSEFEKE